MKIKDSFASLSRFEWALWLVSAGVILICFILSGAGDILTVIASLIGVTALIFVAKGLVLGQILTVAFSVFYGMISFFFCYYGEVITYLCMTAPMAVVTAVSWIRHPYQGTQEVQIHQLTKKQLLIMAISSVIITIAFYFILRELNNANLLFSTISITTSFAASFLTFCRSPYYAIGYAANDLVLIVLWSLSTIESLSYLPMVLCFLMFLANDLYGFYNWQRMQKRQNPAVCPACAVEKNSTV